MVKCPYLMERALTMCAASSVAYLPSMFEIAEYCSVHRYAECPVYCEACENDARGPAGLGGRPLKPSST